MRNSIKYIVIASVVALPLVSFAFEFRTGEQPSVKKDEKIVNDVYMAGGSVSSTGTIDGDLIAGGGSIVVSGDVTGDVNLGGGNVSILSNIGDDLRVGGGTIVIEGRIKGDLIMGGGQITIGGPGIGGDLVIGGGNIRIDAPIGGKVTIGGGNVYINAPIAGDIKIEADKVTLGSSAIISGNLTYKAKEELVKEEGAVVNGEIKFEPRVKRRISPIALAAIFSTLILWKFFVLLASSLLVAMIFRRYTREMVTIATGRPVFELGRGLLVLVLAPIISVLLLATLIGIPLGILGLIGFAALMIFAWIISPIILGSTAYRYFSKRETEVSWKTILLGVFLYSLLGFVPFIGHLAQILLMLLTLGTIVSLKLQIIKEWR